MEYYLALRRNELASQENVWRKHKNILLSEKKPIQEDYMLYDSNSMIFLEKKKLWRL